MFYSVDLIIKPSKWIDTDLLDTGDPEVKDRIWITAVTAISSKRTEEILPGDFGEGQHAGYGFIISSLKNCLVAPRNFYQVIRLIVPRPAGYIVRSDIFNIRLVNCPSVSTVVSFCKPKRHFNAVPNPPEIRTALQIRRILGLACTGILLSPSVEVESDLRALDLELEFRLSFPWLTEKTTPQQTIAVVDGLKTPETGRNFYQAVKALGLSVIILDRPGHWLESPEYAHWREAFLPIEGKLEDGLENRLLDALNKYQQRDNAVKINGLVTFFDPLFTSVAKAARKLGFKSSSPDAYAIATDKFKTSIAEGHYAYHASSFQEVMQIAHGEQHLRYPLVVKPCRGWGSEGVFRAKNSSELMDAVSAIDFDRHGKNVVIEEYCDGPEVDANIVLVNGEVLFSEVSDDFPKDADGEGNTALKTFIEVANVLPSTLPQEEICQLKSSLHQSLLKLGFRDGFFHLEARVKNSSMEFREDDQAGIVDLRPKHSKPYDTPTTWLIEINPRPPGVQALLASAYTYGVDYIGISLCFAINDKEAVRALSIPFSYEKIGNGAQYWCEIVFIPVTRGGTFGSGNHALRRTAGSGGMKMEILNLQSNWLPGEKGKITIFSFTTKFDIVVLVLSSFSAIIAGALNPLLTVIYGQLVGAFQDFSDGKISGSSLEAKISQFTLYFVYLAIGMFVFSYIATVGFFYTGEKLTQRLRRAYLKSIIRQNIAFFDNTGAGELTTRITSNINLVQEAISGKVSLSLTALATFSTAFIIAFVEYWKLALILSCCVVLTATVNYFGMKAAVRYSKLGIQSYSRAAEIAEEAISSIKHVTAFGIQDVLANRYFAHLLLAEKAGMRARISLSVMTATFMGIMQLTYGLSFWQGARFLVVGEVSGARVVTITMAIVIGSLSVGRVAPNAQAFISGIAGAKTILETISKVSPIDPLSTVGDIIPPDDVKGDIILKDISLVYPSRKDVTVLKDLTLSLPQGKTTALVGASGCGKSSIVGLIERFYEPCNGEILLDGYDIRSLNVHWLRQQMSLVSQESVLFSTTIFENIRHGLIGRLQSVPEMDNDALNSCVIAAAKSANAHNFIMALPQAYQTEVGESGLQLSGGQRQRIAIARAIVSNPKILLLDEATSALDSNAEADVQRALETAAQGRTTLVIAHRLSTIRKADNIVVLGKEGTILQEGNHDDLIRLGGPYKASVEKQDSGTDQWRVRNADTSFDLVDSDFGKEKGLQEKIEESSETRWALVKVVWKLNREEAFSMVIGLCCAILAGLVNPAQSILFASSIDALALPQSSYALLRQRIDFWSSMYLTIGIVAFLTWSGQGICFSKSSERLTLRARDLSFRSILRQQVSFFDEKQHSTGALTTLLATKSTQLAGLSGAVLGTIFTAFATLAGGIVLSIIVGWKLALVCTATIPIVLGCGWTRLRILSIFESKVRKAHENSASYASEAIAAIRTAASLSLEDHVLTTYSSILATTSSESLKSILRASVFYAASQGCMFLVAALGFWYGGGLISTHEYSMFQFFVCFAALISGTQSVGAVFSFAPDMSKATMAAKELNTLFERTPNIDTINPSGKRIAKCGGRLEMKNIKFSYPSRPNNCVLDGFDLNVSPGKFLALVGPSGCGKSTVISLLERFFDPAAGQIFLDGQDIKTLNVNDYRRTISLVGQEPAMYQGTIRDNIILGSNESVSEGAVVQACKEANIYDFILSLPDGFSTVVGSRGVLLSGGQKQRIAIARALLRDTKILLLDEATSALDIESEQVVQDALNAVRRGRTTICVAHRLGTVTGADEILVLEKGRVIERGTHEQLIRRDGAYATMARMQALGGEIE
ncbi:hypothetical protein G7Y89_g9220 [Cudoniella acicularis]|uniref:Uncharacterized protein n=1 Tax=Cudoniella acicularis TaxID=354080 RepID=A0A8H4RG10_9HELO|nr:hypothetical protein G7Y89_g9220 [Cudoniella acicularis]